MNPYRTPAGADRPRQPFSLAECIVALILALLVICVAAQSGCGGVQRPLTTTQSARIAVEGAAHVVAALDGAVARRIATEASQPHAPGAVAARYENVVLALELSRSTLVAAEGMLDHGGPCAAADAVQAAWRALVAVPHTLPPDAGLGANWSAASDALAAGMTALARGCQGDGGAL